MSRETEKGLKELQKSSDEYAEEAADEVGVDLFSAQSLVECIQNTQSRKPSQPKRPAIIWSLRDGQRPEKSARNISTKPWSWNRTIWMPDFS